MYRSEEIELERECPAVLIPSGDPTMLPAGLSVRITQALGDTYTVLTENGLLARIDAANADAIGKVATPVISATPNGQLSEDLVWATMKTTYDPEIPVNIVELGLIYGMEITANPEGGKLIHVTMTLTAPGCGMGNVLKNDIERKLAKLPEVSGVEVDVVLDPPWSPEKMSEAAKLELGMM